MGWGGVRELDFLWWCGADVQLRGPAEGVRRDAGTWDDGEHVQGRDGVGFYCDGEEVEGLDLSEPGGVPEGDGGAGGVAPPQPGSCAGVLSSQGGKVAGLRLLP